MRVSRALKTLRTAMEGTMTDAFFDRLQRQLAGADRRLAGRRRRRVRMPVGAS
jgi:hypothetical protein